MITRNATMEQYVCFKTFFIPKNAIFGYEI